MSIRYSKTTLKEKIDKFFEVENSRASYYSVINLHKKLSINYQTVRTWRQGNEDSIESKLYQLYTDAIEECDQHVARLLLDSMSRDETYKLESYLKYRALFGKTRIIADSLTPINISFNTSERKPIQ